MKLFHNAQQYFRAAAKTIVKNNYYLLKCMFCDKMVPDGD
jgi:hypothetical protein